MNGVSACVGGNVADSYCALANPIFVGREDVLSDETVHQILNHNETWEKICR